MAGERSRGLAEIVDELSDRFAGDLVVARVGATVLEVASLAHLNDHLAGLAQQLAGFGRREQQLDRPLRSSGRTFVVRVDLQLCGTPFGTVSVEPQQRSPVTFFLSKTTEQHPVAHDRDLLVEVAGFSGFWSMS